jgi:hypothetical protein
MTDAALTAIIWALRGLLCCAVLSLLLAVAGALP